MIWKSVAGLIAIVLVVAFLAPPAFKLKDVVLFCVMGIGVAMIAVDLWQSLQSKDD